MLLVEDNDIERRSLCELLGHRGSGHRSGGQRRRDAWNRYPNGISIVSCWTCGCPTCPGSRFSNASARHEALRNLPVIVSTGKDLSEEEEIQLRELSQGIVLKGVQSPERLLDEATLFLHLVSGAAAA